MPDHGTDHRLGLQLVDDLHAVGNPGQTRRSHHLAAAGLAWHRPANPARQPDQGGDHQYTRQGLEDCRNSDQCERVPEAYSDDCGAVDAMGPVEAHSERSLSSIAWWEGPWKHRPAHRFSRLTAVFRLNRTSSTATKRNEVDAALSRAAAESW